MAPRIFFCFNIRICIYFFKYKTIQTHAFLPLNVSAVGSVQSLGYYGFCNHRSFFQNFNEFLTKAKAVARAEAKDIFLCLSSSFRATLLFWFAVIRIIKFCPKIMSHFFLPNQQKLDSNTFKTFTKILVFTISTLTFDNLMDY